ncbi:MAG: CRTAC1 family protein [Aureliella sp.]
MSRSLLFLLFMLLTACSKPSGLQHSGESAPTDPTPTMQNSEKSTATLASKENGRDSHRTAAGSTIRSEKQTSTAEPSVIHLLDESQSSGLDFEHFSGRTGKNFLIETVTCGIATFDYDGDGLLDVYLPNGAALQDAEIDPAPTNRLFRNIGEFQFQDVTEQSNASDLGFALGVCVGDLNNDGTPDLVVSNFGEHVVLENQGDGSFSRREVISDSDVPRVGAGVAILDFDRDGNLDLFIANYVDFDFDRDVSREIFGVPAAPGPKDYPPDSDLLFRNTGNGQLIEVSDDAGIQSHRGPGMGVVAFDVDGDFDTDLFVCNDSAPNFAYINQGNGKFVEDALLAGLAYGSDGASQASMGADIGDIDHDGRLDIVSTNFAEEIPNLYLNAGGGFFDDVGAAKGLGVANRSVSWGVGLVDFDNDSWEDCFITAGHLIEGEEAVNDANQFRAPNLVLRNREGRFSLDKVGGDALEAVEVSRGAAFEDFDNDGLLDAVILNLNSSPQLIRNRSENDNRFLSLHLIGTKTNRSGVGAKVEIEVGGKRLIREVLCGRGYQGHFGSRIHFGIGNSNQVDRLKIQWDAQTTQSWDEIPVNRTVTLIEGSKSYFSMP